MQNKMANQDPTAQRESIYDLFGQLANHSAAVVRDEIELVVQGIREKVTAVRSGVLTVVTGVFISVAAFMSFCAALIIGLSSYMAPVMAALVTGAALASVGVVIAVIGYRRLKKSIFKP